jgi:hypothetical protein
MTDDKCSVLLLVYVDDMLIASKSHRRDVLQTLQGPLIPPRAIIAPTLHTTPLMGRGAKQHQVGRDHLALV